MIDDPDGFSMNFDVNSPWSFMTKRDDPLLRPPTIQVYLAGPLTCVHEPDTQGDCDAVREITKRVLESYDYGGLRFRVYDPSDVTKPGSSHTAEEVYETDYRNVANADLVVFNVSVPSLGVGEESQIAAQSGVPRVTVAKRGSKVSRMFEGTFTPAIKIEYGNHAEYEQALSEHLLEIAECAVTTAKWRRPLFAKYEEETAFGRFIFKQRIKKGMTLEALAAAVNTKVSWQRCLERDPRLAATLSCALTEAMLDAVGARMKKELGKPPELHEVEDAQLTCDQKMSLDNLVSHIVARPEWVPDEIIFRLWDEYILQEREEEREAVEYREGDDRVITEEEWRHRHDIIIPPDDLFPGFAQ